MKQVKVGSVFAPLLTLLLCVCPFLTRLKFRRLLGPAGFFLSSKIAYKVWEVPVHLTKVVHSPSKCLVPFGLLVVKM